MSARDYIDSVKSYNSGNDIMLKKHIMSLCGAVFFIIFILSGVQSTFCAEGMLSLSCKKHPEWLDQAVIKIDGISYKFDELEQMSGLPSGHHTIECIYDNKWIFIKSVDIKPNQNNIVNVKFEPRKNSIQQGQSDIKPGEEGCSRPVPVTISFTPSHATLWVKQIYPSRENEFKPYTKKELSPGDYQIYASAEGYITSEIKKFSVPCKGHVTLDFNSLKKEDPYGTLKISIKPGSAERDAIIYFKNLDTGDKYKHSYQKRGYKLLKGRYEYYVSADGYKTSETRKITIFSRGRVVSDKVRLEPVKQSFTNSLGMKFLLVPAGFFFMGTPSHEKDRDKDELRHKVRLTKGFYMQTTEVTQGHWKKLMGNNPSENIFCGEQCPVEKISWYDVQNFIKRLNSREGRSYRLPTEAEWEYACRAGADDVFSFGNNLSQHQANFGEAYNGTLPVKRFSPNAFGFYDMHGNVSEWCQDWYDSYPSRKITDPRGGSNKSDRKIVRGGAWNDKKRHCRSGNRSRVVPTVNAANNIGFRLVVTLE